MITEGWLGEVIEINDETEIRRINGIRRAVFGGTDDQPLRHLGEAQTCFVILNRASLAGSWWISDDREALRYAQRQGITTRETIDLVKIAIAADEIEVHEGVKLMRQMADEGRYLRMPNSAADLLY
ncbi:hypothetical protein [Actinoallomurus sp. NPDC052274]|uniref:hypothetical protein n=1 Tax=Actinoallomurus sp. NPDC052274 TaxID=3155420 RepID=UPI00343B6415